MIHKTALIDSNAKISKDVIIGAYSIIGPNVEIGSGTIIQPHVSIVGDSKIGKNNKIYSFDTRFKISKKYTLAFVIKN